MKKIKTKIFVVGMLLLFMLSQMAAGMSSESTPIAINTTGTLKIATRHDAVIYNRFAEEFVKSQYGIDAGITNVNQISFYAPTTYDAFARALDNDAIRADVAWGGGPTLFNALASDGYIAPITDSDLLTMFNTSIPDELAGAAMKKYSSDKLIWVANAISSFGFTVNHDVLAARGLPTPKTWDDLASPDFFTNLAQANIAMGNAPDTTSNTRIYQIILQKYGWEKGWEILYQMAANGKIFGGSVETRAAVITGETAVSLTIDFYGIIAMAANAATEYIVPANGSIVNGDPMALGSKSTNTVAGKAFMQFAFSQEGQAIWLEKGINRLPIRYDAFNTTTGQTRSDIKSLYDKTIANQGIDFDEDLASSLEEPMRYHFESTITDVHSKLRNAWNTIIVALNQSKINETQFNELRLMMDKPAMTMAEAQELNPNFTDQAVQRDAQNKWIEAANTKFVDLDKKFVDLGIKNVDTNVKDVPLPNFFYFFAISSLVAIVYRRKRI